MIFVLKCKLSIKNKSYFYRNVQNKKNSCIFVILIDLWVFHGNLMNLLTTDETFAFI